MSTEDDVKIGPMFLRPHEALALAQLVKRISFNEVMANAVDEDEAYVMLVGVRALAEALVAAGYNPR